MSLVSLGGHCLEKIKDLMITEIIFNKYVCFLYSYIIKSKE